MGQKKHPMLKEQAGCVQENLGPTLEKGGLAGKTMLAPLSTFSAVRSRYPGVVTLAIYPSSCRSGKRTFTWQGLADQIQENNLR